MDERYSKMPSTLERALLPFQREGARFALARHGRALIGDEMGEPSKPLVRSSATRVEKG